MIKKITLTLALILFIPLTQADDKTVLTKLLHDFLSGQTAQHHQDFWADDLVYTSSNGTRFGKADIMAGFENSQEEEKDAKEKSEEVSVVTYSGTDVDVRVYDDVAIVAFKLVAKENGKVIQTYFNTGTFQKRDNRWQAIAWQATKIPKS